uniref:Heme oxygenase 1 n=1 Tax=Pantholops hodgsonii TaxID=59538 RepID=I7B2U0_PANHO|nr:heme oxygenase-1 [Pantholops hodgsonii]
MERPQPDSMPQDLSEALKEATKEVHTQAENAEFMKNFQKGELTREGFKLVMASLYHIYVALEEEIERNKENPVYTPLYFPEELHRRAALEQDMAFWYGPRWQEAIPYTQATKRYVQRLQEVGRTEPELLVAHAYTRYLGDLSGGQVLKKIAQKALNLPSSGEGLAFFTFPNIASATKFKQLYRSRMNTLEMTPEVRQRVLDEAKTAFLLNIQLFEELQGLLTQKPKDRDPLQGPDLHGEPAARHKTPLLPRRPGESPSPASSPRHLSCDGSSHSAFWWPRLLWGFTPCECKCAASWGP